MTPRRYVDFDLRITSEGGSFVARVVDSPAGQAMREFDLPFTDVGLENFILKLGHSRGVTRRAPVSRRDIARKFGAELYRAVFDGEVEVCFRLSLDEARRRDRGLRIRLRTDEAPALAEIPWEYLYSKGLEQFVTLSTATPLVRHLDLPGGKPPLAVDPPLRVLVMVSSPDDQDLLEVDREVALLRQATADLVASGSLELEVADQADLRTLNGLLRASPYHVFHFIGHGVFEGGDGGLLLEDEAGGSQTVSGFELGVILNDHPPLRLAVLNACEGARGSVEDPVGGVAQTLIRRGLPAVVAMQFEITDEAALVFSHEFYLAIADGYPIDAATAEARKAIFASGNDVEWGTPVLHLRATDGQLFDVHRRPTPTQRADQVREEATRLLTERRFVDAVSAWQRIAEASPEDEAAHLMLEQARRGADAATHYAAAADMITTGRPKGVLTALEQVAELDPDHGDPDHLEERARTAIAEEAERQERLRREAEQREERRREQERAEQERRERERREAAPPPTPPPPPPPPQPESPGWFARVFRRRRRLAWAVAAVLVLVIIGTLVANQVDVEVVPVSGIRTDGNIDDWPTGDAVAISDTAVFPDPGADTEIGGAWLLGWDVDALYLVADVVDPSFEEAPHDSPDQLFRGDSVHFEFGPDPDGAEELRDGEDFHVMLAPFHPEEPVVLPAINPARGGNFVSGGEEPAIEAAAAFTRDGYRIEARVPWAVLGLNGPPGDTFGLNVNVSDGDGGGGLGTMVSSNPDRTIDNQPRPDTWHRARLDEG